jgi:hypothetical protein
LTGSISYTNLTDTPTLVSGSEQIVDILSPLNSYTQSNDTTNTTQNTRLNNLEEKTGSLATTGSNTFYGTQVFSGSVYVKENLIVQGSSSLQNITASAVDIGTNKIILNVNNPSVRYAGISVYDSGSTAGTGSLFWDSVENHWLYEHPSDSAAPYNSAILISGPKNAGNLGEELELVNNYIVKAVGGDHISSSAIYDDGTTIKLSSNTEVTSSLKVSGSISIGTSETTGSLTIQSKFVTGQSGSLLNIKTSYTNKNSIVELAEISSDGAIIIKHALATSPTIMLTSQTGGSAHTYFNIDGNFGIGTTTPQRKFVVADGSGNGLEISNSSGYSTILAYNRTTSTYQNIILGEGTSNVGIGVTNPSTKLYVNGTSYFASTSSFDGGVTLARSGGNVGIGLTNPGYKLSIVNVSASAFLGISNQGNENGHRQMRMGFGGNGLNTYAEIQGTRLNVADDVNLILNPGGGSVGIGTTNPLAKLSLVGGSTLRFGNDGDSGNNLIYLRGGTTGDKASITLNHYGYADYSISAGGTTNAVLSITKTSGGTDGIHINSSGNVGINTTSPGAKLEVKASGDGDLFIARYSGGTAKVIYGYQSGADGYLELRTGADSIITKLSGYSGTPSYFMSNVGIGITNPTRQLHLAVPGAVLRVGPDYPTAGAGNDRDFIELRADGSNSQILAPNESFQIINSGGGGASPYIDIIAGTSGGVRLTNTATSWTGISDIRAKDIIEPVTDAISKLSNLSTIVYKLKDDETNQRKIGLIAQEVNEVLPEVVDIPLNDNIMWGIRYSEIVPVLVKAVQELKAEIEVLKNK